jgi:PEP-CTERM motif
MPRFAMGRSGPSRGAQLRDAVCRDTLPGTGRLNAGDARQNGWVGMKRFVRPALAGVVGLALLCAMAPAAHAGLVLASGPNQGTFATNNYGFNGTYYSGSPSEVDQSHSGGGPVAILFVFGVNGAVSTYTDSSAGTYDNADDTQIGVLNLSGVTLTSIKLTTTSSGAFAFDGDGISNSNPSGGNFAAGAPSNGEDSSNGLYGGPITYFTLNAPGSTGDFSSTNNLSIYANFFGGLANNASTYFSLEGAPSDLGQLGSAPSAPEPASMMMAASGALLVFGYGWRRRKAGLKT